jgi:succinoglycan biosynthesis transport protein ExoP
MPQYDVTLRDYWRILRKRKVIVSFATVMLGLTSFATAMVSKPVPSFLAEAKVQYEKHATAQEAYVDALGETDGLESEQAVITSYPVVERVAHVLGDIDTTKATDEERIQAILKLRPKISTEGEGLTNLISIRAEDGDRKRAQKIANVVAEEYAEYNFQSKNAQRLQSRRFVKSQRDTVEAHLKTAQSLLKEFQEQEQVMSIESQTAVVLSRLGGVQDDLDLLEAVYQNINKILKNSEGGSSHIESMLSSIPPEEGGPIFNGLRAQLNALSQERNRLLINFTLKHPKVVDLDSRRVVLIENMVRSLEVEQEVLGNRIQNQRRILDDLNAKYLRLPRLGVRLSELTRNVQVQAGLLQFFEQKYQEARIAQSAEVREVTILQKALLPGAPTNPSTPSTTAAVGALLGMILGVVFAFIAETLDTSIGTIEDVEEYVEVSVVGIIPQGNLDDMKDAMIRSGVAEEDTATMERRMRLSSHFEPRSTLAESYRALRTNIQFSNLEKGAKVISITSASSQEGKSTTAANLAVTLAQAGNRVLLVDGDLRRPSVSRIFELEREPGITDVILGNYSWREVIRTVTDIMVGGLGMEDIMMTPGLDNLNIITSGTIPPNPSEIVDTRRMSEFIDEVRDVYDIVIVDSPPVLQATDATILGTKVDGVLLVYKIGQVSRSALRRAKLQLDNVNVAVLGVVINGLRAEVSEDFQDMRYYSYYSYGADMDQETGPPLVRFYRKNLRQLKAFGSYVAQKSQPYLDKVKSKFSNNTEEETESQIIGDGDAGTEGGFQAKLLHLLLWVFLVIFLAAGVLWQLDILRTTGTSATQDQTETSEEQFKSLPPTYKATGIEQIKNVVVEKHLVGKRNEETPDQIPPRNLRPAPRIGSEPVDDEGIQGEERVSEVSNKKSATPEPAFTVHVASHKTQAAAKRDARAYKKRDYRVRISKITLPGRGDFYRVLVGQFQSRDSASISATTFKSLGLTGYTSVHHLPIAR